MAVAQSTQAVQTNFGDIVQRGVANVQRSQAMADEKADREYQRRLEFEDRYGIPEEDFVLPDTEIRTVNDAMTETMSIARDRYYDIFKQLQKDPNNLDLKKKLGRVKGTVKLLTANHEKMTALGEKYVQMLDQDKISGVQEEEVRRILEGYEKGNMKVRFDDNDTPQYVFYDDNGQIAEVKSFTELGRLDLMEKVDMDTEMDTLTARLGGLKQDTKTGAYIRTEDLFGTKQINGINDWVDAQMEDEDRMADLLYQATGGDIVKKSGFNEADRKVVADFVERQVRSRYDESTSMKADQAQLTRERIAASRAKDENKTPKIKANTSNGRPQVDEQGNVVFSLTAPFAIDPAKSDTRIQTIKGSPDGVIRLEGQRRQKVNQVPDGVTPQNASAYGYETEGTGKSVTYYELKPEVIEYNPAVSLENLTEAERAAVEKTRAQINAFATRLGYDNEDDFRNAMYQTFVDEFGEETANEMFSPEAKQEAINKRASEAVSARQSSQAIETLAQLPQDQWDAIDPKTLSGQDKKNYYLALTKRPK